MGFGMKFEDIKVGQKVWVHLHNPQKIKGVVRSIYDVPNQDVRFITVKTSDDEVRDVHPRQLSLRKIKPKKCANCENFQMVVQAHANAVDECMKLRSMIEKAPKLGRTFWLEQSYHQVSEMENRSNALWLLWFEKPAGIKTIKAHEALE